MVCLLNLGVGEFNLMYIRKVCRVPPEMGLNMPSKTKDKTTKLFTCTIKGMHWKIDERYHKRNSKEITYIQKK